MTTVAIGIITAPRDKPTLARSIASFKRAGFGRAVVFAEPGSERVIEDGIHWKQSDVRKGNFKNWIWALQGLLEFNDDWLMVCEDDIKWAYDAASILTHDLMNYKGDGRVGMISLYLPIRMGKILERQHGGRLTQGWYQMSLGRKTWGAQCLVLHRNWAMRMLQDKVLQAYLNDPKWDKNVDLIVGDVLARSGREIMYRVPCLVDHTFGDGNSSLGYPVDRPELRTKYFKEHQ